MKYCQLLVLLTFLLVGSGIEVQSQNSELDITYQQNSDNSVDFNFEKQLYGTFLVNVRFEQLSNCDQRSASTYNYKGTISGDSGKVLSLEPKNPDQGIGFSFSYIYHRGKPRPRIKENFEYILPFKRGTKVKVSRVSNLNLYLGKGVSDTWKAFQFSTEKEAVVVAARRGLVVEVVDEYQADTTRAYSYVRSVNKVLIEHRDGTLAEYSGFKAGSINVKEGQIVQPYTELGMAGRYNSDNDKVLRFHVYYLNTRDLFRASMNKENTNMYAFVNPLFCYKGGRANLLANNFYVADCTNELIQQEFTRREKKKFVSPL